MTYSIRRFLLINLLLATTIIIFFTAIGNYFLAKQDIEVHLDKVLGQAGLSFTTIASRDIQNQQWDELKARLDAIPVQTQKYLNVSNEKNCSATSPEESRYRFQIFNNTHHLVMRSANAPSMMLSKDKIGFSDNEFDDTRLRVFSNYDPDSGLTFIIAEPYYERDCLASHIMWDDLYIILITYPLAGLLIWIIIGRGLDSLNEIRNALMKREPYYLESLKLSSIPLEIQPLIQELNRLLSRLKDAFDREKRFAADAAHELRTPLAAIRAQAQVALIVCSSPEQLTVMNNVILGVDRANHIVHQLLSMSRLTPENEQFKEFTLCQLDVLVQEVLSQLIDSAESKNIKINFHPAIQSYTIAGNSAALQILMRNLIDNAIRYTPNGSEINIRLEEKNRKNIIFTVADNGPGIPKEFQERIFERFFRMLGTEVPGSGLGLSIVKQIADMHGAKITLHETDPQTNSGLTVSVIFPMNVKKFHE